MTGPLAEAPAFEIVDVAHLPGSREDRLAALAQLTEVHARFFPEHAHVIGEIAEAIDRPDPDVVVHPWLFRYEGRPVGQFVFHTRLRRGIVLMHFVSLDPEVRPLLPVGWLGAVTDLLQATAQADADERGIRLLGMTGEIYRTAGDYRRWRRLGFEILGLDYREPEHGMHWGDFGEPRFFRMTLMVKPIDAGLGVPLGDVIDAAVVAFMLDHYRLPADHPAVVHARVEAYALPPAPDVAS